MTWRSRKRWQRGVHSRYRIEELEGRALLSITANIFNYSVLDKGASQIELAPHVQDSDPSASVTYHLASTTTADGGTVSVNPVTGLVTYTPASSSSSQDSFSYFAQDSDGNTSATQPVTLNLASIAANSFTVNELE